MIAEEAEAQAWIRALQTWVQFHTNSQVNEILFSYWPLQLMLSLLERNCLSWEAKAYLEYKWWAKMINNKTRMHSAFINLFRLLWVQISVNILIWRTAFSVSLGTLPLNKEIRTHNTQGCFMPITRRLEVKEFHYWTIAITIFLLAFVLKIVSWKQWTTRLIVTVTISSIHSQ